MHEIAYHASHEQFSPSSLLKFVSLAAKAGFDAIHCSDHFHPWSERQGQSGLSFAWLGAAMHACELPFSFVCAPGQRYHPAIVAQAIATLGEMFPGRIGIELGSGEYLNESITGDPWPGKEIRNKRLLECHDIIRRLLNGEMVNYDGEVKVKDAKLYTRPSIIPALFCAAISEKTSGWAGSWADGLITTGGDLAETRKKLDAFRSNGGEGKACYVQLGFSYAQDRETAIEGAYDQWRSNMLPMEKLSDFHMPQQFDAASENIDRREVAEKLLITSSIHDLLQHAQEYFSIGATRIILHNVNRWQEAFINDFGEYQKGHNGSIKFNYQASA